MSALSQQVTLYDAVRDRDFPSSPGPSPELIDIIIDNLHNVKHSLRIPACYLTSKQWVASFRFHLFSNMAVTPRRIHSLLHFLESHSRTTSHRSSEIL